MDDIDNKSVKKVSINERGMIEVVVEFDPKKLEEKFVPYYNIQEDLKRAILPVLTQEILKHKEEIVKKALTDVNWPEIVRSEVAQRVIADIAHKY